MTLPFALVAAALALVTVALLTRAWWWPRLFSSAGASGTDVAKRPSTALLVALAAFVVGVAALGYEWVGSPAHLAQGPKMEQAQAPAMSASAAAAAAQIEAMVDRLAQRLKAQPDDVQGWMMLARSYIVLARYPEAVDAYKKADALRPNEPTILADMAYAVAMANHRNLQGEPLAILQRALAIDPKFPKALALAGTAAFDRRDFAGALQYWETLAKTNPGDSAYQAQLQASIAEARRLGGL